jgi:hypothetical protein
MADNPPATPAPNSGPRPTLPGSGTTGRLKNPTTQLPVKRGGAGKIVVMLSSVAKPPPAGTQALPRVATPLPVSSAKSAPSAAPPEPVATVVRPPPLPPKQVTLNNLPSPSRPQLSATTYVKLPPKTAVPGWSSLSGKPRMAPASIPTATQAPVTNAAPPLKTPETIRTEPKKPGAQHIPPIKLNEPVAKPSEPAEESIFLQRQKPEPTPSVKAEAIQSPGPTAPAAAPLAPAIPAPSIAPVEAKAPEGIPVSLDMFEQAQAPATEPPPPVPVPEAKDRLAPLVAPPLVPPQRLAPPPAVAGALRPTRPPPLPPTLTVPIGGRHASPPALSFAPPKPPEPPSEKLPHPLDKLAETPATPPPAFPVAPPMLEKAPEPLPEKLPPPLAMPVESPAPPSPILHVAPPMLEQPREAIAEKLAQPHLPVEARKNEAPSELLEPELPGIHKAPALLKSEVPPPKPLQPPRKPRRSITSWLKKSTPVVVSSSSRQLEAAPIAEAKPALKPPALPSKSLLVPAPLVEPPPLPIETPKAIETPGTMEEPKASENVVSASPPPIEPVPPSSSLIPPLEAVAAAPAAVAAAQGADEKKSAAKVSSKTPSLPPDPERMPTPLTRAERAQKRRFLGLIFFWAFLFPATIAVLFWASLRFGRDTRVEGQVIPPPGTVLSNEVWIVTDFRSLASGITEDLAAERTPLMQEIQERQDHVQRAQADVASREERIRLIREEIAAAKAEIDTVVKQARDATQQIWDVDGAQADAEYASRMDQLKHAIADRAKSLKLNYQPDATYNSPEVWANAYRLALYQVPAGVDGVKEHAWLSDQMKQWRDFQKSMDDRTEQLREKAAQIKLGPAPRIADLNSKIDGLQQRIDATEAEEVPLKAELQTAQDDLVQAQASDAGLDDKYYKQLDSLPGEAVIKRIDLKTNGRFTWVDDNVFVEAEKDHFYYLFARATRADGRQYWALARIDVQQNAICPVLFEPASFISTKAILRPNLSPEEQAQ